MARLYNKTAERKKRHDESYGVLLQEHTSALGIPYDPDLDVWRLEFELHREAVTSLKLAPESDAEDTDADIEAELSAEELPHVGTLPKLFAHLDAIFQHLSYHWLRLVTPSATQVRARWPLDPTWALLRKEFGQTQLLRRHSRLMRSPSCVERAIEDAHDCCARWRMACSTPWRSRIPRWPRRR